MAETVDDLSTPLGQQAVRRKRRFKLPFSATQALAVLLGVFLLVFLGFALFGDNPLGGEPIAHLALRASKVAEEKPATEAAGKMERAEKAAPVAKQAAPGEQKTITIIDGKSGARHDVVISGNGEDQPSADKPKDEAAPGPVTMTGVNPRLLEQTRYGMIPIMAEGLTPFTVYAAEADRTRAAKTPVVSIVIGGLGVGAAKTTDAIMKLPGAVTLAFTPYGSDPTKLAERARAQHHEIFLQVPMEPYDYPDNDPGPQTLLATLGPEQNLDRLYWHLGRLQGYAGIANFMGARFVATDAAMQPIMREAAKRGLGFFDDGSAPRSVAGALAASQAMPFVKGDVTIDAVPTSAEIDRALAKLESLAKDRGYAVGTASALPISIERIGAWIKALEAHGVMLAPLTTTMLKSKSS
jgi:polysaccharide deacetylase 2 family uncharacterized protein YibQ